MLLSQDKINCLVNLSGLNYICLTVFTIQNVIIIALTQIQKFYQPQSTHNIHFEPDVPMHVQIL